ncbi:hypothetical protein HMN09_01147600 [Mycena chlorophos]|uniref:non-specific serine/threonine protein kinase n=1 Tax=Mycena chlorophos TaxID=658473 RepID=A0A8H6S9D5_MYCCL|nr:hypothetical protein HMN09_01147600 [Mycena chlorophos]
MASTAALRAQIASLDDEIALQKHHLANLQASRDALVSKLNRVAIHPVLTLPPEITSQIFVHCVGDEPLVHPGCLPLVLLRVCTTWAAVARSTPALWSTCTLQLPADFWDRQELIALMNTWFSMAGTRTLDLTVISENVEDVVDPLDRRFVALAEFLASRSNRVSSLTLAISEYDWASLVSHDSSWVELRMLRVDALHHDEFDEASICTAVAKLLQAAPHLVELDLGRTDLPPSLIPTQHQGISRLITGTCEAVEPVLAALRLLPNLLHLVVDIAYDDAEYDPAQLQVVHNKLQHLELSQWPECPNDLLDFLTLPEINVLAVRPHSIANIGQFFQRSSPAALTTLKLRGQLIPRGELPEWNFSDISADFWDQLVELELAHASYLAISTLLEDLASRSVNGYLARLERICFVTKMGNSQYILLRMPPIVFHRNELAAEENAVVQRLNQPANFLISLDHLIATLEFLKAALTPRVQSLHILEEKIRIVFGTLKLWQLASYRLDTLYAEPALARGIFTRLLHLCIILELWRKEKVVEEAVLMPRELEQDAIETAVYVLRCMGNTEVPSSESKVPRWETMRDILVEAANVVSDIISRSSTLKFPIGITLFSTTAIREANTPSPPDSVDRSLTVTIESADHISTFVGTTLSIIAPVIVPPLVSHWATVEVSRYITDAVAQSFLFCMGPFCVSSLERRVSGLPVEFAAHTPNLPLQLLRFRLVEGPDVGWDELDVEILEAIRGVQPFVTPRLGDLKDILSMLTADNKTLVIGYMMCCVASMPVDMVRLLRPLLPAGLDWAPVRRDIAGRLAQQRQAPSQSAKWREELKQLTQDIIFPITLDWMDGDEGMADEVYAQRAIDDVTSRYSREISFPDADQRFAHIEKMAQFLCLASACVPTNDCRHPKGRKVLTLESTITFVGRFLDGPESEVTSRVKRRAFNVLALGLHHHCGPFPRLLLDRAWAFVWMGTTDPDRNVRLAAGSALVAFIELFMERVDDALIRLPNIFEQFRELLQDKTLSVAETFFITVGSIGKVKNSDLLGHVVTFLMSHLGNLNPVLKGTASMQLIGIAEHYGKTLYAISLPHFDLIAPYLVLRLCSQQELIVEACKLMHTRPHDFIEVTLGKTMPSVLAQCDVRVIEAIAQILHVKPSVFLLRHKAEILSHLFLLPEKGHTERSLGCLLGVLRDSAGQAEIGLHIVVKSSIVELIAQLVIVLGHEDKSKSACALPALQKIEKVMMDGDEDLLDPNMAGFLQSYMLGVVADVNDILRDGRGKIQVVAKKRILRSLGVMVKLVGPGINNVAPQIMATFQTMVSIPALSEVTLESWRVFLSTPSPKDIGPHVGPTSAAFVASWSNFSLAGRELARKCLEYIVIQCGPKLGSYLDEVVNLDGIPELDAVATRLRISPAKWTPKEELQKLLDRVKEFVSGLASGDIFDALIGQMLSALFSAASREGDGTEVARMLAFECIGALGAVDPDRFEIGLGPSTMVMVSNFTNDEDSIAFVLHLIRDVLVGAFRSTSDIRYQTQLAYCIQELLQFCKFTPCARCLPKHVVETVAPLLAGRFVERPSPNYTLTHPLYPCYTTYREWLQWWTFHLISRAVRNKDVVVAHHLLPHLVLNVILSDNGDDASDIRNELQVVLEDQVNENSQSTDDKKLLSAQVVFTLLDHLNKWVRLVRQDVSAKKDNLKRSRHGTDDLEEQLMRVDSILSNIDQHLMARAALKCKAYARSLMNFEWQIATAQERSGSAKPKARDLNEYYERLHEIYSQLDEPDGMEGVSTLILEPTLEHQIRQHESTGHWTSAQSCWEVRLQESPDNLDFHLGLLRCLRNLGHYDTLRTHVRGVLTRNADWQEALAGYQIESAWMVGAWDEIKDLVEQTKTQNSSTVMARVLLAMRSKDQEAITSSLSVARSVLGMPITAAGPKGYRRAHDAALDLHRTHELELIYTAITSLPSGSQRRTQSRQQVLNQLHTSLSARLDSTLPTFRAREPILSMRRTAFALVSAPQISDQEIGRSWLASAKIARKAGQWQTAYSAMLQARQHNVSFAFIESAKLVKATGEPLRALQELENSMRMMGLDMDDTKPKPNFVDLTGDEMESRFMPAKAQVVRARWMSESERYDSQAIFNTFYRATELHPDWESCHFHLGRFHDDCYRNLSREDKVARGLRMNASTVKSFARAIRNGSKYVYQTVPRLLTIWLDVGESKAIQQQTFTKMNEVVAKIIKDAPVYKWYTAFPQIVSRVGHTNEDVYKNLARLIIRVLEEYPKQALWLFTSVVKSTKKKRQERGLDILKKLMNNPATAHTGIARLVNESQDMTYELLRLCDFPIKENDDTRYLSMQHKFPALFTRGKSDLIIPLQESLTASLPPTSALESTHQPFPLNAPTFEAFFDEIEIMRSLAKPRKITMRGSNGQIYMFLGKPKDDLRKDARLMDFNAILNKLLKSNSESRRRQLHIRTYGVVTLNEECGFIQWVPNTTPLRPVLMKGYDTRRIKSWSNDLSEIFNRIKTMQDPPAGDLFKTKVLTLFPPVFHDWFIEMFPEPSAWLASRLAYSRTAAVMSMVGFILGLGDRHCENILLDINTGDVVHVDFNCLFEKGKSLETPERVPFRLTQNIVDGLGVTGVEGVFRIACEVTLQLLRDNKDSLMSVLDAFIHDPLVEWEDEKRKIDHHNLRNKMRAGGPGNEGRNAVKPEVDLRMLGKNALKPIERKLKGLYSPTTAKERPTSTEKEISTGNLVQMLIQEATELSNLAKMYPGWAAWH